MKTRTDYVNYSYSDTTYQAGPYHAGDEVQEHERDIKSYAGITAVFVTHSRNKDRTLIASGLVIEDPLA